MTGTTYIRVRYGETDQMGYVYHGNYAMYFEQGRVEFMRTIGLSYRDLEGSGTIMPVLAMNCRFFFPARYDDFLKVETILPEIPKGARIKFEYKITNQNGKLLTTGSTELAFVNKQTQKPIRVPKDFIALLKAYQKSNPEV